MYMWYFVNDQEGDLANLRGKLDFFNTHLQKSINFGQKIINNVFTNYYRVYKTEKVLQYLQEVLFIRIWTVFMNILNNTF
jgi:hypothetical protein